MLAVLAGALAIGAISLADGSDAQETTAQPTAAPASAATEAASTSGEPSTGSPASPTVAPPSSLSLDEPAYAWKLADLSGGKAEIVVANDTPKPASFELRLTLDGLAASGEDGDPLAVGEVLRIASGAKASTGDSGDGDQAVRATGTIPAGGSRAVVVATDAKVAAGVYGGQVTAFSSGDRGVVRAALSLTVPGLATVTATPAATSQTMQAVRWIPFLDETVAVRGNWIALSDSVEADVSKEDLTLEKRAYLGALAGDKGGVAAIRFDDRVKTLPSGLAGIEIDTKGFDGPGDYKGKLDLTPSDPATGTLELTVVTKDSIVWAIVALLIGLGAALGGRRLLGARQIAAVGYRATEAHAALRAARRRFRRKARGRSWRELDSRADYEARARKLHDDLAKAGDRSFDSIPEADRKLLSAEIDKLRAHADSLDSLHEAALSLETAVAAVEALPQLEDALPDGMPRHPAFVADARDLLAGERMTIEQLDERVSDIEAGADRIDDFPELHERVARAVEWMAELKADPPPGAEDEIRAAGTHLTGAWSRVWQAPNAEAAFDARLIGALSDAVGEVAGLKAWQENVAERGVRGFLELTDDERADVIAPAAAAVSTDLRELTVWGGGGDVARAAPRRLAERRAHYAAAIGSASDWILFFGLAAAVLTGLIALYFGKSWGTPTDYLTAVLWGFTTTAAVDTLATAMRERANPDGLLTSGAATKEP